MSDKHKLSDRLPSWMEDASDFEEDYRRARGRRGSSTSCTGLERPAASRPSSRRSSKSRGGSHPDDSQSSWEYTRPVSTLLPPMPDASFGESWRERRFGEPSDELPRVLRAGKGKERERSLSRATSRTGKQPASSQPRVEGKLSQADKKGESSQAGAIRGRSPSRKEGKSSQADKTVDPYAKNIYDNMAAKGRELIKDMVKVKKSLKDSDKTKWKKYSDISKYGWTRSLDRYDTVIMAHEMEAMGPVIKRYELPSFGSSSAPWVKVTWVHDREVKVHGKTYRATFAIFSNIFNLRAGVIVASHNSSPRHTKTPAVHSMHYWSDIMSLTWEYECTKVKIDPGHLTYIVQINIVNTPLDRVLSYYLPPGKLREAIIGHRIDDRVKRLDDEGANEMLIGSPNGAGAAYLLIQHKRLYGEQRTCEACQDLGFGRWQERTPDR